MGSCRTKSVNQLSGSSALEEKLQDQDQCVTKAFASLNIDDQMNSDPDLLKKILAEDMFLADLPSITTLLEKELRSPLPLYPMIQKIRQGIYEKQPAIHEFLCAAIEKGIFPTAEKNNPVVIRTLNHMYIFNIITKGLFDSPQLMVEVKEHFLKKRKMLGIDDRFLESFKDILKLSGGLFFTVKTKTMDWVFDAYEDKRKVGNSFTAEETRVRQGGLVLNVIEAVVTDRAHGNHDNALAGVALAINPPKSVSIVGNNAAIEYELSQEWASLYETWNLAFITVNMDNLQLLYPKLLIPQVMNAPKNEYLFNRALALWTSINFYLFGKAVHKPDMDLPGKVELAKLWGPINLKYAKELVKKENNRDLKDFSILLTKPVTEINSQIFEFILKNWKMGLARFTNQP